MEKPNYAGMTVNERLFVGGILEKFDSAINAKDLDGAISILRQVDLEGEQARQIVEAIFRNPKMYGYPRSTEQPIATENGRFENGAGQERIHRPLAKP